MKTREEMISEIVGEFDAKFRNGATSTKRNDEIESFLRSALLKMSDASINAVEVEKMKLPKTKCLNAENHLFGRCFQCEKIKGFNFARTASQEKRREFEPYFKMQPSLKTKLRSALIKISDASIKDYEEKLWAVCDTYEDTDALARILSKASTIGWGNAQL